MIPSFLTHNGKQVRHRGRSNYLLAAQEDTIMTSGTFLWASGMGIGDVPMGIGDVPIISLPPKKIQLYYTLLAFTPTGFAERYCLDNGI